MQFGLIVLLQIWTCRMQLDVVRQYLSCNCYGTVALCQHYVFFRDGSNPPFGQTGHSHTSDVLSIQSGSGYLISTGKNLQSEDYISRHPRRVVSSCMRTDRFLCIELTRWGGQNVVAPGNRCSPTIPCKSRKRHHFLIHGASCVQYGEMPVQSTAKVCTHEVKHSAFQFVLGAIGGGGGGGGGTNLPWCGEIWFSKGYRTVHQVASESTLKISVYIQCIPQAFDQMQGLLFILRCTPVYVCILCSCLCVFCKSWQHYGTVRLASQ